MGGAYLGVDSPLPHFLGLVSAAPGGCRVVTGRVIFEARGTHMLEHTAGAEAACSSVVLHAHFLPRRASGTLAPVVATCRLPLWGMLLLLRHAVPEDHCGQVWCLCAPREAVGRLALPVFVVECKHTLPSVPATQFTDHLGVFCVGLDVEAAVLHQC